MRDENPTKTARLLVMGHKKVGKSASIVRFTTGRFIHSYSHSTRDWLYKRQLELGESQVSVELLELEDQQQEIEKLAARDKFAWADAFIIIYSLTNCKSFDRAKEYLEKALKFCKSSQQPPILILANKCDFSPAVRQISFDEGLQSAALHNCLFGEISVLKSSSGLETMFTELVKRLDLVHLNQSTSWACQECGAEKCLVKWPLPTTFRNIPLVPVKSDIVRTSLTPVSSSAQVATAGRVQSMRASLPASKTVVAATVAFCRPLLSKSSASSFKRASLAIVGSKTLLQKKHQQQSASLIAKSQQQQSTPLIGTKKSSFRYKERIQTVAFEPAFISSNETDLKNKQPREQPSDSASLKSLPVGQDSKLNYKTSALPRPKSSDSNDNQSTSSLASRSESRCVSSTVFGGVGPNLTSGPRAVLNKLNHRKDSRSTLSRASTSGGSCADDEDEIGSLGEDFPNMWPDHTHHRQQQPVIEKVYVQNGGCTVSEAAKVSTISFCKALMKAARGGGQNKAK